MIDIKESHEVGSEIIPQILSIAIDYGRLESTFEAVERWYEFVMEKNKEYRSFTSDVRPLGVILGIEEEFEEEQKPEAKAMANININVEATNGST